MKIILTETQIKKLTMFQPGNEMSLNEIKSFGKEKFVLYDVKYLYEQNEVDGRL